MTFNFVWNEELPGLLISAATVDRLGRKLSMSAMFFLCCIFLLPLVIQQSQGLTTSLLFGARICITATFTIVYIYAPEVNCECIYHFKSQWACKVLFKCANPCFSSMHDCLRFLVFWVSLLYNFLFEVRHL